MSPLCRDVVAAIVRHCDPQRIILFGSHARGVQKPTSDIDVLVVDDRFDGEAPRLRGRAVRQLLYTFPVPVDVLFHTWEEVEDALMQKHSFLANVVATGIEVHRRG